MIRALEIGLFFGSLVVFPLLYFSFERLGFWRASFLSATSTALFWLLLIYQPTSLLNGLALFVTLSCFLLIPAFLVGMVFYSGWTERQGRRYRYLVSPEGRITRMATGLVGLLFGLLVLPLALRESPMNFKVVTGSLGFIAVSALQLWAAWHKSPRTPRTGPDAQDAH